MPRSRLEPQGAGKIRCLWQAKKSLEGLCQDISKFIFDDWSAVWTVGHAGGASSHLVVATQIEIAEHRSPAVGEEISDIQQAVKQQTNCRLSSARKLHKTLRPKRSVDISLFDQSASVSAMDQGTHIQIPALIICKNGQSACRAIQWCT